MNTELQTRADALARQRHELRTPLNHIIGYSEMLMEEAQDRQQAVFMPELQRIHASGKHLLSLINKVFAPAQAETGPPDLRQIQHELLTPLNAVVGYSELLEEQAGEAGQQDLLPDFRRINSAARHLLALIREGLGVVDRHGAPPATGAAQTELQPQPHTPTRPIAVPAPATEPNLGGAESTADQGTLLVVDDNELNRDMLARRLERLGYRVTHAEHGRRALELLGQKPFDLVLLDLMMPEMDGYEVLEHMKGDPALRVIPVIVLSASDDMASVVRCIEHGAEDHLPKPFDPVLLRARIGACLEKKRLRDRERSHLRQIEEERKRSDDLLHVLLPHHIALELKTTQTVKPRRHENVGVLFCDVVGFTAFCERHEPEQVIEHLQLLMRAFETIAARCELEKIKTIGDCFMATAGLLTPSENPALQCVRSGLEMVQAARQLPAQWRVHVGIHVGPVIAGIVGSKKYLFDVWGDTVNTASRIDSVAHADTVCVSGAAWNSVAAFCHGHSMGSIPVKGKGEFEVFCVESIVR